MHQMLARRDFAGHLSTIMIVHSPGRGMDKGNSLPMHPLISAPTYKVHPFDANAQHVNWVDFLFAALNGKQKAKKKKTARKAKEKQKKKRKRKAKKTWKRKEKKR